MIASQPRGHAFLFAQRHLAQFRKHLFRRSLPNMAGVQDHQIGIFFTYGLIIAVAREKICDLLRIVHIHLTAIRLDVELAAREILHSRVFARG